MKYVLCVQNEHRQYKQNEKKIVMFLSIAIVIFH